MSEPKAVHQILERRVRTRADMLEIEEAITRQLGGEGYRCAFLRSRSYIRLRSAALHPAYFPSPCTAYHGNLSVILTDGPTVTLLWLDRVNYFQDEWCYRGKRPRKREREESI
jgi:hypothetical protein